MSKLSDYIDILANLGIAQGVSASNSVLMQPKADQVIIMSYTEPTDRIFPLNGLWLISDPKSASYKKLLRRSSKTASASYANTWSEVTDYDDMMNTVQYYADEDLPQPSLLSGKGGRLLGKLLARTGATAYDTDELIPRTYVDTMKTGLNSSFFTMFNNMNQRVNINTSDIRDLKSAQTKTDTRLSALEISTSSIMGKTFLQKTAAKTWVIQHDLGQGSGFVYVLSDTGETIWPETINPLTTDPDNAILLTFLEPVSGVAQLCYIPLIVNVQTG